MIEPQFFFSTLAQASAAVVGFVVAVAAALYSLERQRVERRTDEYRDALTDFKNRYGFAIQTLTEILENEGGEITNEMVDVDKTPEDLEKLARSEVDDYPVTSLFLAHMSRILEILSQIEPRNDYVLSAQELEALEDSVNWFYEHFYQLDEISKELIKETTGEEYCGNRDINEIRIFNNSFPVPGMLPHELKRWFEERKQVQSEILRPKYHDNNEEENDLLTGDNFWTLKTLAEYLMYDLRKVSKESSGTVIRYNPGIKTVVKVSTYLILIGVFLPTTFLFSSPVTLPQWFIFSSQILLLVGSLLLSLALVELVLRSTEPWNEMGNTGDLSSYSSAVVNSLPDLPY